MWFKLLQWYFDTLIFTVAKSHGYPKELCAALVAQARLETDNYKDGVNGHKRSENKNLFGMRHPTERKTTSVGSLHAHAKYSSYKDSVVDRIYWDEYNHIKKDMSPALYMAICVAKGYNRNPKYVNSVMSVFNTVYSTLEANVMRVYALTIMLGLVAVLIYFLMRGKR